MFLWENPEDRLAIVQMNAELRHAQLELLSAERATHQLRLRFSSEDIARYAERDVLRRAIAMASSLNEFYSSILKQIPSEDDIGGADPAKLSGGRILRCIAHVADYLRDQRGRYYPMGKPISAEHRATVEPFFSSALLDQVRVVTLDGDRIPNPPFYEEARALGFVNLPDVLHMASLTFVDALVFNEPISDRTLFHALVHAAQFNILGVNLYTDLFVRGYLRTNAYFSVPLEAHTFALDSKFARNQAATFSVDDQIRLWIKEGRY